MKVEYTTNNSGGEWWLKDKDWIALEKAGWYVDWGGMRYFCHSKFDLQKRPDGKPEPCPSEDACPGHRRCDSIAEARKNPGPLSLDSLAKRAQKEFDTPGAAMREFQEITEQSVTDEGCNHCGPPHNFSWKGGSASGEDCENYLGDDGYTPGSGRRVLDY